MNVLQSKDQRTNSVGNISRKRKHSHYKSLDSYFQVDEKSMRWGGHHLNLPKDDLRVKYSKKLKA